MIRIHADDVLVLSASADRAIPFAIEARRNHLHTGEFLGSARLELEATDGELFADVSLEPGEAILSLEGQTKNIRLQGGSRMPVAITCRVGSENDSRLFAPHVIRIDLKDAGGTSMMRLNVPVICQLIIFSAVLSLTGEAEKVEASLPVPLAAGDRVLVRPNAASRLWSGEIPHPDTGPDGWIGGTVPPAWDLPLPGAPPYALLLVSGPEPRLVGNSTQHLVVGGQSGAGPGLAEGTTAIAFQRNDPFSGRAFTWGQFDVEVTVTRG